jgi:hypothetical protein
MTPLTIKDVEQCARDYEAAARKETGAQIHFYDWTARLIATLQTYQQKHGELDENKKQGKRRKK